jgi:hypothetical protein
MSEMKFGLLGIYPNQYSVAQPPHQGYAYADPVKRLAFQSCEYDVYIGDSSIGVG